jgi:hypothetical protein
VAHAIHSLQGSSATLGAVRVATLCAAIVERARKLDTDEIGGLFFLHSLRLAAVDVIFVVESP